MVNASNKYKERNKRIGVEVIKTMLVVMIIASIFTFITHTVDSKVIQIICVLANALVLLHFNLKLIKEIYRISAEYEGDCGNEKE